MRIINLDPFAKHLGHMCQSYMKSTNRLPRNFYTTADFATSRVALSTAMPVIDTCSLLPILATGDRSNVVTNEISNTMDRQLSFIPVE